ncbi:MAG: hypothetical protein HC834_07555, partial [Rhodospirillales bacterium]|nr:hypothetical protein [Rhodospirillales bacterium]
MYSYLNPSTGRWLSRDPIGERGGSNLYAFTVNDGLQSVDVLGHSTFTWETPSITAEPSQLLPSNPNVYGWLDWAPFAPTAEIITPGNPDAAKLGFGRGMRFSGDCCFRIEV